MNNIEFIVIDSDNESDNGSEVNVWFCDHCDDEQFEDNHYSMGQYADLCEDCYNEFQRNSFVCECCGQIEETDVLVEDEEYGPECSGDKEHMVCFDCFINRVVKDLPVPECECGKPCLKKDEERLWIQLDKKTYVSVDEDPTKHPFHHDCCKVCEFGRDLADWNIIPAPNDVGLVGDELRLILGDDLSAMINRCLGGTEISKRFKGEEMPVLKCVEPYTPKNKWTWNRIAYMRANFGKVSPELDKAHFGAILDNIGDDEPEAEVCKCPFPKFIIKDGLQICTACNCIDHYKNGVVSDWSDDEVEDN